MKELPFKAYEGKEQYIFISYAHINSEMVFPIIRQLNDMGYRIWYDEGIDPGSEWPESIAEHLSRARAVILFISPESMASDNVRREITFALNFRKLMLSVYLKPTELSPGMILQLGTIQAIFYYQYKTDAAFFEKLLKSVPTELKEETKVAVPKKSIEIVATEWQKKPDDTEAVKITEFDPKGIVLPFMPTGTATLTLKSGEVLNAPVNTLIVPKNNANFAGMSFQDGTTNSNYYYGAGENFYPFKDIKSFEVSPINDKLGITMNLLDGTREFRESNSFDLEMLVKQSCKKISLSEITSVMFDHNTHIQEDVNLSLITTTDGISFYTPTAMLTYVDILTSGYIPHSVRFSGITRYKNVIEFRKFKSIIFKKENASLKLLYELKSGLSEELDKTQYYNQNIIGVNQYGCFALLFTQIERIDIFGPQNENAPLPTPLPYVKWPETTNSKVRFYGEGCAEITTVSGDKYKCPANAMYALTSTTRFYLTSVNANSYITIYNKDKSNNDHKNISFSDISTMRRKKDDGDNYFTEVEDVSGVQIQGTIGGSASSLYPMLVFPKIEKRGTIRLIDVKEIVLDHDAVAPEVKVSTIYSSDGKIISIPKGCITFSDNSGKSYPGSCFRLPTGNYIEIDRLKRMVIYEQKSGENDIQNWLVFECDDFYGAFPLTNLDQYTLFGTDSFGLVTLGAVSWKMIDMR
ncbi:MAG: toll/interleukin-1 receptor domain-containing protein [Dysgonamonadaceae bacterium]|jgi:hypothetical protein|nr:toll/interleukin-1 receptor domain-containing protein [Dysgonamonadaceae bacterium]